MEPRATVSWLGHYRSAALQPWGDRLPAAPPGTLSGAPGQALHSPSMISPFTL